MADNKTYYYLKLKENFFDSPDMKLLQSMKDGYLYSDILLKLYLLSLSQEGRLMYRGIIPYTPEMIASITQHQVGTVEKAMDILTRMGLIEILDNGAIYMLDIQNFIGKSSTEADRKREYRSAINAERERILANNETEKIETNVGQMSEQMSDISTPEIRDKSIENREQSIEVITVSKDTVRQTDVQRIVEEWNALSVFGIAQVSRLSSGSIRYKGLVARVKEYGVDKVLEAIDNIRHSSFLQGRVDSRKQWVITFDWFVKPNNFPKVLEGNYADRGSDNVQGQTSSSYGSIAERLLNENRSDLG